MFIPLDLTTPVVIDYQNIKVVNFRNEPYRY